MSAPDRDKADGVTSDLGELFEHFGEHFNIVAADTADLLDRVYRLRYEVYCVENAFLDPAKNPGGRETDEFDENSAHSLLIHRQSGATCGTVRLILPDPRSPTIHFPVHAASDAAAAMCTRLPYRSTAEISRFAVSKSFRRRLGEARYTDVGEPSVPPAGASERRILPHITYGLMRAVLFMSLEHGITHLCAVMEPALLRLMSRFGLRFEPAGALVEYHGMRQPCFAALDDLLAGIRRAREDMWTAGTEGGRLLRNRPDRHPLQRAG